MRTTAAILLAIAATSVTHAELVRIAQTFHHADFATNGWSIDVVAVADASNITGVGQERAVVTSFTLFEYRFGIGQNGYRDNFSDPYADLEGNVRAVFNNGVFTDDLATVSLGGNGFTSLLNFVTGTVTAVAAFGDDEIIYGTTVFNNDFIRVSSEITVIPSPAAATPLAAGLLLATRRRR